MPFEIETKLIMTGENPAGLREELADLGETGPFIFMNKRSQTFRDTYYDTAARSLSGKGIALRTRERAGRARPFPVRITIKGNEHFHAGGAAIREEFELDVTEENKEGIVQALRELPLSSGSVSIRPDAVRQSLEDMGLSVIQDRLTQRITLDTMTALKPGKIIAELALDEVRYSIGGGTVLHYELEVEAAGNEDQPLIEELTGLLEQARPDRLRRWNHNKLVTGFALKELWTSGKFPVREGKAVCLDPAVYDAVDTVLKGKNPG